MHAFFYDQEDLYILTDQAKAFESRWIADDIERFDMAICSGYILKDGRRT
jgi:hypothetical protein